MEENEKQNQETKSKKELKKEEKARVYQEKLDEKRKKEDEKSVKKEEKERKKNSFGRKIRNFFLTVIFVIILIVAGFFGGKYFLTNKEKEINKSKMKDLYNSAIKYLDDKNYDKALEIFDKIDEDYEKYEELKEKVKDAKLNKLEDKIEEYASDEKYLEVLEYLNENYDKEKDLRKKIEEYRNEYREKLIAQIKEEMKTDLESARKKTRDAINILDSDEALQKLLDEIDNSEPISLNTLDTFQTGGNMQFSKQTKRTIKDNLGDSYTDFILVPSYSSSNGNFAVYKLNKQYTKFTGKACVNFDYRSSDSEEKVIKIYGDDKLLYTSQGIKAGVEPFDISVDITGVDKLRIEMDSTGSFSYFIGNPTISK